MSSQPQVRVYGEDWCGDCRRTNAFLKKKNVNYVYVQFTDHPEARAVCQQITKAQKFRIPVVVFPDNSFMTEPSDGELEAKLRGLKIL